MPLYQVWAELLRFFPCRSFPKRSTGFPVRLLHHNSVASCRLNKFFCFFRCSDIAVSDYRNGNRLFHLPDNVPVRLSAIILLSRPSVNRNRRRSRFFRRSCDFDCIYMRIVEPFSDFYRNGLLYCFNDRVYNLINKRGVFSSKQTPPRFLQLSVPDTPY